MSSAPVARCAVRLLGTYAILILLFLQIGSFYSGLWCKPIAMMVSICSALIVVDTVDTQIVRGEPVFRLRGMTSPSLALPYGASSAAVRATTLQAYAHVHFILVFAILMAYPVVSRRARLRLLMAGIPSIIAVTLLDLPFTLAGVTHSKLVAGFGLPEDSLIVYYRFLQQGGRQLLALCAAILAITCCGEWGALSAMFMRRSRPRELVDQRD